MTVHARPAATALALLLTLGTAHGCATAQRPTAAAPAAQEGAQEGAQARDVDEDAAFAALRARIEARAHTLRPDRYLSAQAAELAELRRLTEQLVRDHANRLESVKLAAFHLFIAPYPGGSDLLLRLYDNSNHPQVRRNLTPMLLNEWSRLHDDHATAAAARTAIGADVRALVGRLHEDFPQDDDLLARARRTVNALDHSVGDPLPDIRCARLRGGEEALVDHRGKILVVDFWATWCPPCVAALPGLAKFKEEMTGRPFEIIGLSMDRKPQDAIDHMEKKQPMPWVNCHIGMGSPLLDTWGINGYPTYFVVDAEGVIRTRVGEFDQATKAYVRELVSALE